MNEKDFDPDEFLKDLNELDSRTVTAWRKKELEAIAKKQGEIARCPNSFCNYIVPLTEMTIGSSDGKRFCTICQKEFDLIEAEKEARRFLEYERRINEALKAAGFSGKISDLRRTKGAGIAFSGSKELQLEIVSRFERFRIIIQENIPDSDRK